MEDLKSIFLCFIFTVGIFVIIGTGGSGDKDDPGTDSDNDGTTESVSYISDIKTILDTNCILCHAESKTGSDRNGAPTTINLDTYENVISSATLANTRIQAGTMPPSGGLSETDKKTVQSWIDAGTPENDTSTNLLTAI